MYLSFPESHLKEILTFLLSRFKHKVHSQSQKKNFFMASNSFDKKFYYKCTNIGSEHYWCATSVTQSLETIERGECQKDCNKGIMTNTKEVTYLLSNCHFTT